ncbi:MAG: hypothetical protein AAB092_08255, partial [Chloroflexota bacterium]
MRLKVVAAIVLATLVAAAFTTTAPDPASAAQECDLNLPTPTNPPGVLIQRYVYTGDDCSKLVAKAEAEHRDDAPLAIILPAAFLLPLAVLVIG